MKLIFPRHLVIVFVGAFLSEISFSFATNLETVIQPTFTGSPLILDSLRYENSEKETLSFTRVSFLLSGFALEKDAGGWIELSNQHAWCDAERHRLQFILHDIPPATYRAIRFYFGPDKKTNHADISKFLPITPSTPTSMASTGTGREATSSSLWKAISEKETISLRATPTISPETPAALPSA